MLLRLDKADSAMVRGLLERRWRSIAPKKLLKDLEAPTPPPPRKSTRKTEAQIGFLYR